MFQTIQAGNEKWACAAANKTNATPSSGSKSSAMLSTTVNLNYMGLVAVIFAVIGAAWGL
jgi:hypothetical protein